MRILITLTTLMTLGSAFAAERRLSVEDYRDKMAGAWIGQSVGVAYGWPTEFREWYRNQVPAELKTQYSFGMFVDPAKHTISHGGAYATHASANWEGQSCLIRFVQKR